MHPSVWEASGHVSGFNDPMVDCKACKRRFRADQVSGTTCPECDGELTEPRQFNLMFKTHVGPVQDDASISYLRPETAQGIFCNFANVCNSSRMKVPFGIAQVGKSFRNEINPRNFTFRSREFEQMEIEFFCEPGTDQEWFEYWKKARYQWYLDLGIKPERLHMRDHAPDELAHYAKSCVDIEYDFPFGRSELEGVANRTDYDLKQHIEKSGKRELMYFDEVNKKRFIPYVIEPSGGVDRALLAFLVDAFEMQKLEDGETRTVLHFHPRLAPIKVAVLPLVKKDGMPEKAKKLMEEFRATAINAFYDESGAIGRRYRRMDEAGTPYCITVDGQSVQDDTVTIRYRDSMRQDRISISQAVQMVREKLWQPRSKRDA
jgi:glycyl-tRNA synthetase